ncbi:MAG: periplasmic heavy metal sensor, partial [Desulfobacteraceae bacterium]|nr:periplasmic heavy metal sensor [Desulfobacteraceae bacterium]
MKAKPKALICMFSLVLNVVFMGIFAAHTIPVFKHDRNAGEPRKPLFLDLDLTAEQLARFKSHRDKFKEKMQEMRQPVGQKQVELIELLAASSPDQQAIEMKQ